ncbi:toll-like receptor 1 [Astyanax mexicanus]|uniref:toll-like receptor 1 n=1 Tax=Astyanax mexicanus TaxID=7994 RepID=UPI0020CB3B75|nr:toll-like receptor 1 [Astyanax mexicanus]
MKAVGCPSYLQGAVLASFLTSILAIQTIVVDFHSRNLSAVPSDLPSSAETVDLSQNRIQTLRKLDFSRTPDLKSLNLSWNILEDIHVETFASTPVLETLDLSHNRLQTLSNQLYLLHTQSLQYLDLSSNRFTVMKLGIEFSKLLKLRWLGLSAGTIRFDDFESISHLSLQTLFIQAQNLINYEEGSLAGAKAEKLTIVLTNKDLDHPMILDALMTFREVELSSLNSPVDFLRELVMCRAAIQTVHLHLSAIQSTWKVMTSFFNSVLMSTIRQFSVSNLTLTEMRHGSQVFQSSSLDSFSVRQSSVKVFIFSQKDLYDFFINMPAKNLTLASSPIVHMTCPAKVSKIQMLDFSDCALSENVFSKGPQDECDTLTNLETLILKGNNLRHLMPLTSRVKLMTSLRYVDFSQNSLTYDEGQGSCTWPLEITHLDLSSNGFDQVVFKCLPRSVVNLNIQNNRIFAIPANISGLDFLKVLDLTSNRLLDLPDCLGYPNLEQLFVRRNSLHVPSLGALETCPHLQVLDTSHNPYICTCPLRGFITLIDDQGKLGGSKLWKGRRITLDRWPNWYRCSYPESWRRTMLQNFTLPEITCNPGVLAATILVPAISLVIIMGVLCRQLDIPWYAGMIWKWTRAKHRARTSHQPPEELQGVFFHAFISYSQRNSDWVKAQLLPKLEGEDPAKVQNSLRICHHERDFIPGKTIVQNILRCIEQSRCCIFVLSSHFVQSEWCHYELYFASHQRLTRGLDSIILILLEPLPPYLIPSKYHHLKAMMARRTYLEWPQDKTKQRMFWANLRAVLQADLPRSSSLEAGNQE